MALLLTGAPGVGKTTVLRTAARMLEPAQLVGFYTEEIRLRSTRQGFRLVAFDGEAAVLAHVTLPAPRVSKYGVDVAAIDRFARRLRPVSRARAVYLIDEIGKMECLSSLFVEAVTRLLDSGAPVVATVAQRGGGFIDAVKRRGDVELWVVTRASRDALPDRVVQWVEREAGHVDSRG